MRCVLAYGDMTKSFSTHESVAGLYGIVFAL